MMGWKLPMPFGAAARARKPRRRLRIGIEDTAIYAIGDVHGCLDQLLAMEAAIARDAASLPGRKLIVMLGDYVDRGEKSAGVLDHLTAPPPAEFERICILGNHDVVMQEFLEGRTALSAWLSIGGAATLMSYGVDPNRLVEIYGSGRQAEDAVRAAIPDAHLSFLRHLPVLVEAERYLFVHAGIRPDRDVESQSDEDLVHIRAPFLQAADRLPCYVVHGHTPVDRVAIEGRRVNLDTGAFFSGRLSALRIWQNRGRVFST